jgi:hypothetical protein
VRGVSSKANSAGDGGHDAVAGIKNRLPIFFTDAGGAQKSDA